VFSVGYRTFGTQCEDLSGALGAGTTVVADDGARFFEHAWLLRFS
jgi:hypothetical protein